MGRYFFLCFILMLIVAGIGYLPWPINFAIAVTPAVALVTYLFWPFE